MKKYTLLIVFLAGILLVGIGTGIAFGEYSAFSYGGDVYFGEENSNRETLECFIPVTEKKTVVSDYMGLYFSDVKEDVMTMAEDDTLEDGRVCVEVIYNPDYIKPILEYREYANEDNPYAGQVAIYSERVISEFEWFLKCKDDFLDKMKDKRISNYYMKAVESITVKANSNTMAYLEK